MCKCTPEIRTPFCGKPGCEWPVSEAQEWKASAAPRPEKRQDGVLTRIDTSWFTPAEKAITDAMRVVEQSGGSRALTDAVNLLQSARDRVADHVEGKGDTPNHFLQAMHEQIERRRKAEADLARFSPISPDMMEIIRERIRQVSVEGWSSEHDDEHADGALRLSAICYLLHATGKAAYREDGVPKMWPWLPRWWKPTIPRRDLVKAGALLLAESDRLARAGEPTERARRLLQVVLREMATAGITSTRSAAPEPQPSDPAPSSGEPDVMPADGGTP